jgi:hypothetical protein
MTRIGKAMLAGLALATASLGVAMPAQARTYVEIGIGSGGYHAPYYREGYRYRDWDRERWHRHHYRDWRRDRHWRGREGWRGDRRWRGRDRCWTQWGWTRWGDRVPVRVCR